MTFKSRWIFERASRTRTKVERLNVSPSLCCDEGGEEWGEESDKETQ